MRRYRARQENTPENIREIIYSQDVSSAEGVSENDIDDGARMTDPSTRERQNDEDGKSHEHGEVKSKNKAIGKNVKFVEETGSVDNLESPQHADANVTTGDIDSVVTEPDGDVHVRRVPADVAQTTSVSGKGDKRRITRRDADHHMIAVNEAKILKNEEEEDRDIHASTNGRILNENSIMGDNVMLIENPENTTSDFEDVSPVNADYIELTVDKGIDNDYKLDRSVVSNEDDVTVEENEEQKDMDGFDMTKGDNSAKYLNDSEVNVKTIDVNVIDAKEILDQGTAMDVQTHSNGI